MTFAQLQTEFYARGFEYLNDGGAGATRAKRWINEAYLELCEMEWWPFLETTTTGTAPITFTDLREILSVVNSTTRGWIPSLDRRSLVQSIDGDLTTTGTAAYYYLEGEVLKTYPANTSDTLAIRYLKVPAELSADADTLLIPSRYQGLVVDGAVVRGYTDSDNFQAAQSLKQQWDYRLGVMTASLMGRTHSNPETIVSGRVHEGL